MKLRVQNYQSVKDVNLTIEGLTVLKGQSNAGKSSILKALYAATHNRFRRGAVSWGEDSCVVLVQYTGEKNILRVERAASGASPKVRLGCKETGYQNFGKMNRDLPAPIQDYNNFGYIQLTPQEKLTLNFSPQFSKPLMVQFSNKKIVDILAYSKATEDAQHAYKQITERNQELKGALVEIDSAVSATKATIGELKKQFLLFKDYDRIEQLSEEVVREEKVLETLTQLISLLSAQFKISKEIEITTQIVQAAQPIAKEQEHYTLLAELQHKSQLVNGLESQLALIDDIVDCSSYIESLNTNHSTVTALKDALLTKDNTLKDGKLQRKIQLAIPDTDRLEKLKQLYSLIEQTTYFKSQVEEAQDALNNATCPVCGTPLNLH